MAAKLLALFSALTTATNGAEVTRCSLTQPCDNNGTCNIVIGQCSCMPGYGGSLCQEVLLPSCRYTKDYIDGVAPAMRCR